MTDIITTQAERIARLECTIKVLNTTIDLQNGIIKDLKRLNEIDAELHAISLKSALVPSLS